MAKMVWFNVYKGRKEIDSVPFTKAQADKMSTADVKRSLVNHDGYDPDIRVTRARKRNK